ncbi:BON domain protein [compost metagenome]
MLKKIKKQPWAGGAVFNVQVTRRVAHLWGIVRSEEERRAMVVAAETVDGIKEVKDHLSVAHWVSVA